MEACIVYIVHTIVNFIGFQYAAADWRFLNMYSYTYELLRTLTRTEKRQSGSGVGEKVVISAPVGRGGGQVAVGGGGVAQ